MRLLRIFYELFQTFRSPVLALNPVFATVNLLNYTLNIGVLSINGVSIIALHGIKRLR